MDAEEKIRKIESDWNINKICVEGNFGFFLGKYKKDFCISVYDLDKGKEAGKASFFTSDDKELKRRLGLKQKEIYLGDIKISPSYQGKGLSKNLLEESFKILKEKKKPHVAMFWKKKGVERLLHQFENHGYIERNPADEYDRYSGYKILYKKY